MLRCITISQCQIHPLCYFVMLKLASPLPDGSLLVFSNQKSRRVKEGEERCHFTVLLPAPTSIISAVDSEHQFVQ